jgi:glycosyltransferase involved in cell wall biosynthesis
MKVVHITPYYPPYKGGISSYVSGLVQTFDTAVDMHIICRNGSPSKNVTVLGVGKGMFIIKTIEILRKLKPDVIHCHSHWYMLSPAIVQKRLHRDVKVFFTFHTEPQEQMGGVKSGIFGKLLSKCDAVTFVSEALQKTITNQLDIRTRRVVTYPGVSVQTVSREEVLAFSKTYGIEGKHPLLVFVGLLEWGKKVQGVLTLLEAVASLREKSPSLMLLLIGDGSKRTLVENKIESLNLSSNAKVTGFVDNVFVPLSICDIYTHISLQEGLPQAILEAMALGKPVIASRTGGIPEIIKNGETGILVETQTQAVASALENLIPDDQKKTQLGMQAKRSVEANFTWKRISECFREVYASS